MIGHMILRKYYDGEDILGLKVIGGQRHTTSTGGAANASGGAASNGYANCGAFIEKVKRGSVADIEGQIRPGKHTELAEAHSRMHAYCI